MKEILKEIAPGAFTHSHWEDENGDMIIQSETITIESKLSELWNAYQRALYSTIDHKGKLYGNSEEDIQSIDDALWIIGEGLFPAVGVDWHTYKGEEVVKLFAEDIKGLKFASVMKKQQLFAKYSGLESMVKSTEQSEWSTINW